MGKKALLFLNLILACCLSFGDTLLNMKYNADKNEVEPKAANIHGQLFPVFSFQMPEGYTDFELKASDTNFVGTGTNPTDSHDGSEVIFYFNSRAPYIGTTGIAPLQSFDINNTQVLFQCSRAIYYNHNGTRTLVSGSTWDPRHYIKQIFSSSNTMTNTQSTNFDLRSYIGSDEAIGGAIVVVGFDSSYLKYSTFRSKINPLNHKLVWSIRFINRAEGEKSASGNAIWRPIYPVHWTNSLDSMIDISQTF